MSGASRSSRRRASWRAFESITVVDPACGSGAYLLGMMQELIEVRGTPLGSSQLIPGSTNPVRHEATHHRAECVWGGHRDRFAVNIAMLRLWLSLIVEYDGPATHPACRNWTTRLPVAIALPLEPSRHVRPLRGKGGKEFGGRSWSPSRQNFLRSTGAEKEQLQRLIPQR